MYLNDPAPNIVDLCFKKIDKHGDKFFLNHLLEVENVFFFFVIIEDFQPFLSYTTNKLRRVVKSFMYVLARVLVFFYEQISD